MNKKLVVIIGGAFFVSMLMALMVQAMLGGDDNKNDEQLAHVLVASKDIQIGEIIGANSLQWQAWPEDLVFSGAILREHDNLKPEEATKGRAIRAIAVGEPILETALIKDTDGNFLAASLGKGMRAMAIKVSAESSVGGFVTPGDHVDVIMTYSVRVPSTRDVKDRAASIVSRNASQTVLKNVRVLAVDQEAKTKNDAKVGRTVTLEVDSKGSEKLALATSMGELSLVLRKLGETDDADNNATSGLTTDVLMSNVLKQITQASGAANERNIRIYNGDEMKEQPIRARKTSGNGLSTLNSSDL